MPKECLFCQKQFAAKHANGRFCCRNCYLKWRYKNEPESRSDWRNRNRERRNSHERDKYKKDSTKVRARNDAYMKRYPDRAKAQRADYRKRNPFIYAAARMRRIAAKLQATPKWADLNEIKEIYKDAAHKTKIYNLPYDVDHIIPLQGKNVCGLHVAWNLRAIPKCVNQAKHAKFEERDGLSKQITGNILVKRLSDDELIAIINRKPVDPSDP